MTSWSEWKIVVCTVDENLTTVKKQKLKLFVSSKCPGLHLFVALRILLIDYSTVPSRHLLDGTTVYRTTFLNGHHDNLNSDMAISSWCNLDNMQIQQTPPFTGGTLQVPERHVSSFGYFGKKYDSLTNEELPCQTSKESISKNDLQMALLYFHTHYKVTAQWDCVKVSTSPFCVKNRFLFQAQVTNRIYWKPEIMWSDSRCKPPHTHNSHLHFSFARFPVAPLLLLRSGGCW